MDLEQVDPELLLRELHARQEEDDRARAGAAAPLGAAIARIGAEGRPERVPELAGEETPALVEALRRGQRVIYGVDDRDDLFEVSDPAVLIDADSVVALVDAASISDNGDGTSTLNGPTFGAARGLCPTEPFREQPTVAFCSGFLVDPSFVATAAHCVEEGTLAEIRFVFGFEMRDATTAETRIDNDEIYRGIRIVGRQIGTEGTDWAVVQLDRPVLDHPSVRIRRSGTVPDAAPLHVIGHPSGLPKKYAPGAAVRDNAPARFFVANLDTYGGNSGSPVFHASSHVVEGILVRGETDFVSNGSCIVSNVCPANGCRGEDCTRTTEFAELVPPGGTDCIPFDPDRAAVRRVRGRWKVVAGRMILLDTGASRAEAERALEVIRHYRMNAQCFVGRPHPSMEYWLVDGEAPQGSMAGEDCIGFDPAALEVRRERGSWKLVEGSHWLLDFAGAQDEARQALSTILRHGFRRICFVGRPGASMTYFRR